MDKYTIKPSPLYTVYQINVAVFIALPFCLLCQKDSSQFPQLIWLIGCSTPAFRLGDGNAAIHARFSLSLAPAPLPLLPLCLGVSSLETVVEISPSQHPLACSRSHRWLKTNPLFL